MLLSCCVFSVASVSPAYVYVQVRSRALDVLFGLLRDFGPGFSATFWALVFRGVLLPLFDDVRHIQNPSPVAGGSGQFLALVILVLLNFTN